MNTFKTIAAAFAATTAAFAVTAAPVCAGNTPDKGEALVHYSDLNLASEEGRKVFNSRIERAAAKICGRVDGRSAMDRAIAACQRETLAAAKTSRDLAIANYSSKRLARADRTVIRLVAQ